MSPLFNIGSFKKSPLVNRVRNMCRDNSMDSALDSLRMQSINISHIRDLSTGLKSSSSDSSCEETESYQRIEFPHRKRFYERRQHKVRTESLESLNLERNNTFSEYEKRKNHGEDSLRMSTDSFQSPLVSDSDYKTPTRSNDDTSPLQFLLNYKGSSNGPKEEQNTQNNSDSFESLPSGGHSPVSVTNKGLLKSKLMTKTESESESNSKSNFVSEPISGATFTPTRTKSTDMSCPDPANLSYSFNNTCYVFRIFFEPKLSTVKETTFIPSRIIINKSPFIIGSDASCDLVLSKRKFKFIAPRHCKITYHAYLNSPRNSLNFPNTANSPNSPNLTNSTNLTNFMDPLSSQSPQNLQYTQNTPKSPSSPSSPLNQSPGNYSPSNKGFNTSDTEQDQIIPYKVKIVKSSPSRTTYVNNSLLRGNLFLENGDLISLGPRNNYLTFRVVFRTKTECQLLRNQLTYTNSVNQDSTLSGYQTGDELKGHISSREDVVTTTEDERIVLADDLDVTGVKIFLFQVFNYSTKCVNRDKSDQMKEDNYDSSYHDDIDHLDNSENMDNEEQNELEEDEEMEERELEASENQWNKEYNENKDNKDTSKHVDKVNQDKTNEENNMNKYNEDNYNSNLNYSNTQYTESSGSKHLTMLSEQFQMSYGSQSQPDPSQDSDYYRLRSPMRSYNPLKSPPEIRASQELYFKNLESLKSDPLMEVYSSSERILNSFSMSGTQQTQESNTSQSNKEESEDLEDEEYLNKVNFLKSITPTNFPVVIDTNRSSLSGSTTPTGGRTYYKMIGMVDACNNMNISELLPIIDEQVRNNIDKNLTNFQVVLKKFNRPVDREMLDNSWVFQLEFLDTDNPKIRRAIFKNEMFKGGKEDLEKVLKDNKCRVIYIKAD